MATLSGLEEYPDSGHVPLWAFLSRIRKGENFLVFIKTMDDIAFK